MRLQLLLILFLVTAAEPLSSCTTFLLKSGDELAFGRNYDWNIGYGMLFTNNKGVMKRSFTSDRNPASWVSKYGSVTFNQFGKEFPMGGMNETGLVVELMWLDETQFPQPDERPAAGGILQWIQYQLDNHSTVKEVIDSDNSIRITPSSQPVHFLVADREGNAASIEFLEGKLVCHTGSQMKYPVLANDSYKNSAAYYESSKDNMLLPDQAYERSSFNRFSKACGMISEYESRSHEGAVNYAFRILGSVAQEGYTQWSIVYDVRNLIIHFRTQDSPKIKNIDIVTLSFDCNVSPSMLDIHIGKEGNVNSSLLPYSHTVNRKLIEDSYNGVEFLRAVPQTDRDRLSEYPDILECR